MSGLVNFAKKTFKKLRDGVKKVLKSKVFKVVAIAAAVVFTGGAALAAAGATGGGLMATLSAGFQGGLAALGNAGMALWNGVKAAATWVGDKAVAAKNAVLGGGGAGTGAPVTTSAPAFSGGTQAAANFTQAANAASGAAAGGMHPLTQAAMVGTGGQVIAGYAQGRAQEEQEKEVRRQEQRKDRYGYNGYGEPTGDLYDPSGDLQQMSQRQGMIPTLDQPPVAQSPVVEAPKTPMSTTMRDKLLASLDSPNLQLRAM